MSTRLDDLMVREKLTNKSLAERVDCSPNYISQIRAGSMKPGLPLGEALCRTFPGELTLRDLGIVIDPAIIGAPPLLDGNPAPAASDTPDDVGTDAEDASLAEKAS